MRDCKRRATRLSAAQGWVELNEGCAGAGYTHPGQVCMTTYREQIDALADANPDVIVVSGAVNDLGSTLGEIEAAAQATFVTLTSTFPNARVRPRPHLGRFAASPPHKREGEAARPAPRR